MGIKVTCPKCKGEGWYHDYFGGKVHCNTCSGKGEIILSAGSEICNRCDGEGMVWTKERLGRSGVMCDKCSGKGIIKIDELRKY